MDGQHVHAKLSRLADGCSHSVRDVVILEVEKHTPARTHQFADNVGAFRPVELHADLIRVGGVPYDPHDLPGSCARRYIQRNDHTLPRVHTPNFLSLTIPALLLL